MPKLFFLTQNNEFLIFFYKKKNSGMIYYFIRVPFLGKKFFFSYSEVLTRYVKKQKKLNWF